MKWHPSQDQHLTTETEERLSETVAATRIPRAPDIRARVVTKASNVSETLQPTRTPLAADSERNRHAGQSAEPVDWGSKNAPEGWKLLDLRGVGTGRRHASVGGPELSCHCPQGQPTRHGAGRIEEPRWARHRPRFSSPMAQAPAQWPGAGFAERRVPSDEETRQSPRGCRPP